MEKILEYIRMLESEYVDEDIESLTPRDRLNFYLAIKEFEIPKLQRAGYISTAEDVESIQVNYKKPKDEPND